MTENTITLHKGREKSVLLKHPWIFESAIKEFPKNLENGDTVIVEDHSKNKIAIASYSQFSKIRARIWTWDPTIIINAGFLKKRVEEAIERRKVYCDLKESNAQRLVFGEADGLPGLIVDQYRNTLVVQILSVGPEHFRFEIFNILNDLTHPDQIFEKSDVDVRVLEGLEERKGMIQGNADEKIVEIYENGIKYRIDIENGQKTGFYIDQRRNRFKIQQIAQGRDVLNCFCYSGGFTLNAIAGNARSVVSVDSSATALEQLNENLKVNGFDFQKNNNIEGDVFKQLRLFRDQGKSFDLIILDPPKFAPTVSQAEKASRGYKDINLLAIKLLRPGGILATFSCSGGISRELFQKIVTGAALDAGSEIRILDQLSQSPDHPVALNFPESFYLKGLICIK
ncbi:MAG: class I SAM-dependent rRNA methyltransferase [Chloroflexi bacterium]|nr:class I SAM-dependent rRNA methyltransferase [Chloroflexota bacterium]